MLSVERSFCLRVGNFDVLSEIGYLAYGDGDGDGEGVGTGVG